LQYRTLNNLHFSDEVKGPDKAQLDQDIGRDQYCKKIYDTGGDQNKDLRKVPAEPEASVLRSNKAATTM